MTGNVWAIVADELSKRDLPGDLQHRGQQWGMSVTLDHNLDRAAHMRASMGEAMRRLTVTLTERDAAWIEREMGDVPHVEPKFWVMLTSQAIVDASAIGPTP